MSAQGSTRRFDVAAPDSGEDGLVLTDRVERDTGVLADIIKISLQNGNHGLDREHEYRVFGRGGEQMVELVQIAQQLDFIAGSSQSHGLGNIGLKLQKAPDLNEIEKSGLNGESRVEQLLDRNLAKPEHVTKRSDEPRGMHFLNVGAAVSTAADDEESLRFEQQQRIAKGRSADVQPRSQDALGRESCSGNELATYRQLSDLICDVLMLSARVEWPEIEHSLAF
jgi:hypothetical protein